VCMEKSTAPILLPYEPDEYWTRIRKIIREEVGRIQGNVQPEFNVSGLTYKPLFKFAEICTIFKVSRPTIYDWIKHGKLRPYKIRSRVYFLWNDIEPLINPH
jgi:excisionase family DNA binding protein